MLVQYFGDKDGGFQFFAIGTIAGIRDGVRVLPPDPCQGHVKEPAELFFVAGFGRRPAGGEKGKVSGYL